MIRYQLQCEEAHLFEGWFKSSDDFDRQAASGLITCPVCNSAHVGKAIMAPAVATSRKKEAIQAVAALDQQAEMAKALREMVKAIRANADDVGEKFPEEARKIHYGEAEARGIIGNAKPDDVAALIEEGIDILPLPSLPEDAN